MKMYIMVKDGVPANMVPVICSHASLSAYLKYKIDPQVDYWVQRSFKKVVCKVDDSDFEKMLEIPRNHIITESSLGGEIVAVVLLPRNDGEWPPMVRKAKLYNI